MSEQAQRVLQGLAELGPAIAIDSSIGTSVAVSNGTAIFAASSDDPLGHAEVVADLITEALESAGVSPSEIRAVVAGMGPGPFTGLRVGIAAAKAFAIGVNVELRPMVSHEAVAHASFSADASQGEVFVVTDARRKQLFGTRYARPDRSGIPVVTVAPALYSREILDTHEQSTPQPGSTVQPTSIPADALIELAALRKLASRAFEPDVALYLREPDVTLPGAPKRVLS